MIQSSPTPGGPSARSPRGMADPRFQRRSGGSGERAGARHPPSLPRVGSGSPPSHLLTTARCGSLCAQRRAVASVWAGGAVWRPYLTRLRFQTRAARAGRAWYLRGRARVWRWVAEMPEHYAAGRSAARVSGTGRAPLAGARQGMGGPRSRVRAACAQLARAARTSNATTDRPVCTSHATKCDGQREGRRLICGKGVRHIHGSPSWYILLWTR